MLYFRSKIPCAALQRGGESCPASRSHEVAFEETCRASRLRPSDEDEVSILCIRMARIMMLETESREAK